MASSFKVLFLYNENRNVISRSNILLQTEPDHVLCGQSAHACRSEDKGEDAGDLGQWIFSVLFLSKKGLRKEDPSISPADVEFQV